MSWGRRGSYSVNDFFQAARQQRTALQAELAQIEADRQAHLQNREALVQQATAARKDLAQSLLPGLVPDRVARARDLVGYAPWRTEDPIARMEADRATTAARIAQIEADPLFARSELLFHPRTGTHTRELAELQQHHATQAATIAELSSYDRFVDLVSAGYGTEAYDVPFWRLRYYDDWKAHDHILEMNPGKTFADLTRRWFEATAAEATLRAEVERVGALVARGRALWDEHAALTRRLGTLPGEHLVGAQARLLEHVLTSHAATMRAALERDPALLNLYLRASALDAKVRYLDHLFHGQIATSRDAILRQLDKLARDEIKFHRPKNAYFTFEAGAFERRFMDRRPAWDKRRARYRKHYVGIWGWDDWDDVPDDDFVWWDVMTDGRPDGDVIPEVADYRRRHGRPAWIEERRHRHHDRDDAADAAEDAAEAAAAAAAFSGGDVGGGGGIFADRDPS